MKFDFEKALKTLLILFVLSLPLTNRDLFSLKGEFLLPVRIIFLSIFALVTAKIFGLLRGGRKSVVREFFSSVKKDRLFILLALLWLVRVISIVNTKNLMASLNLLAFYSSMVILYLVLKHVFSKDINFTFRLFRFYLIAITYSVIYALTQVLTNLIFGINLPGLLVGGNYYRVPGPFYDANHLPPFLITGIPTFISRGFYVKNTWAKVVLYTLALISSIVLFLTFSRSGYIGFGLSVGVALIFLLLYRYWSKVLLPISLVVFLLLIVFLSDRTSHSIVDRLLSVFNQAEKSTQAHTLLLQGEIDLFLKNPLIGVGYGSFSEHFRDSYYGQQHLKIDKTREIRLPPHSIWFEVLTETGILGISIYAIIMFTILHKILVAIQTAITKQWRIYLIALFASVAGILVSGVFYSYNLEFFWFFLFFSYFLSQDYRKLVINSDRSDLNQAESIDWFGIAIPAGIGAVSSYAVFNKLAESTLIEFDEGIYGLIAKNMVITGQYLIPHFKDSIPWLEKPPLYMWLTSFMIKLFGVDSFSVRFWSAFFGVSGVLVAYFVGRKFFNRSVGVITSLALLSSFHYLRYSRLGMLDVTLTFFMTLSILLSWVGRKKSIYLFLSGIALGLGFMTKSFVSLLVLPVILSIAYLYWVDYRERLWILFFLGFLAIVLPWHIYIYQQFGQLFVDTYFWHHIAARFATDVEGKTEPFWIYLSVIRNSLRIWFPILWLSLGWATLKIVILRFLSEGNKFRRYLYKLNLIGEDQNKKLLIILMWILAIFFPLSFARSKLIWYIVPLYPALSLIMAVAINDFILVLQNYLFSSGNIKNTLALKNLSFILCFGVLGAISTFYLYSRWDLVETKDYNRDIIRLIYKKAQLEPTGQIPLAFMGVGEAVPKFYSETKVEIWPENLLAGLAQDPKARYYLIKKESAQAAFKQTNVDQVLSVEAYSGDYVLLKRQGWL